MNSTNPIVANAVATKVVKNASFTYQQAVSKANDAIKKMKDITAKIKPWRAQMEQMRKTWDSIDSDFFYDIQELDGAQKAKIEELHKEFQKVRTEGHYNFYSI